MAVGAWRAMPLQPIFVSCYHFIMPDSWLDHIPSHEREKIRKRLRSPEEYEKLREKVKGPEDLEKEMEKNEAMAELRFALESEPDTHDALKSQIEKDLREQGIEGMLEGLIDAATKSAIEQGNFRITVSTHPLTHQDQVMIVPEGNVQEQIPITKMLNDRYVGQFQQQI
jgi:hypothetical protein